MIKCDICFKKFKSITTTHLKSHNITMKDYRLKFPNSLLLSDETRIKIRENNIRENNKRRGIPRTPEAKANMSASLKKLHSSGYVVHNKGIPQTEEQKKKQSETKKRKFANGEIIHHNLGQSLSVETKQKISNSLKGNVITPEQRLKIGAAHRRGHANGTIKSHMKGKKHSSETKQKLSIASKRNAPQTRITKEKNGTIIPKDKLPLFILYERAVTKITNNQPLHQLPHYDKPRGLANKNNNDIHQLDHIYSVTEGFKNNIPPYIIGDITNLRFLPWFDNISKSNKCHSTIDDLCDKFFYNNKKLP